ncbi:hypothetical protein AB4254_08025 [Vibrio breoganii]
MGTMLNLYVALPEDKAERCLTAGVDAGISLYATHNMACSLYDSADDSSRYVVLMVKAPKAYVEVCFESYAKPHYAIWSQWVDSEELWSLALAHGAIPKANDAGDLDAALAATGVLKLTKPLGARYCYRQRVVERAVSF